MALRPYDAGQLIAIFGTIVIDGFGPDTAVTVAHDEDDYTLQMGVDGDGTRSKSNTRSATITLSLMQSSPVNDLLSAQRALDLASGAGAVLPLLIKDGSGTSLYTAEKCWIQKPPDAAFAREAGTREWILRTDNLIALHGSN